MLLIYTHKITHRNKYIFNLVFKDTLGIGFALTDNKEEFIKSEYYQNLYNPNLDREMGELPKEINEVSILKQKVQRLFKSH